MTTNVPPVTWSPATGFIAPTEAAILAGVQADQNAAFGGDLNPALNTPQGQLASSETALIGSKNDIFLKYVQQVDPAYADGRMQDAIARIYFLERKPAASTTVTATVTGLAGVTIPTGSLAVAADGNLYAAVADIVIPSGGSITGSFASVATGPIACGAHSLTAVYKAIAGWDSIDNSSEGTLGANVESRADFEFRRQQSVLLNSVGSMPAVRSAVFAVSGVTDCYAIDNSSGAINVVGGVSLAPNSIYVSVSGGDDQAVANAIWTKKAPGCAYNGNTTKTVQDTSPLYTYPFPSYSVTFERPDALPIKFAVTIATNPGVPANYADQVKDALIAAFAGADGGPRARIGSKIFASRFYAPVAALGRWAEIVSLLIGTSTPTLTSVTVNIDKVPTVAGSDITVSLV